MERPNWYKEISRHKDSCGFCVHLAKLHGEVGFCDYHTTTSDKGAKMYGVVSVHGSCCDHKRRE